MLYTIIKQPVPFYVLGREMGTGSLGDQSEAKAAGAPVPFFRRTPLPTPHFGLDDSARAA